MTPAERALLLEAANAIGRLIAAVEAEAAPADEKSCETCAKQRYCSQNVSVNFCGPERLSWLRRHTEADACPTCNGDRYVPYDVCPDCGGTGKKGKK